MIKKIALISILTACLLPLQAQITQGLSTQKDGNGWDYFYEENDPLKARIYILENGLTVYLSDYKTSPRIQTFVAVRTGSANDPADNTGLAHYLEHILFKGTSKIGTSNWEKEKPLLLEIERLFEAYKKIPMSDTLARKEHYAIIDSVSYQASQYAIANEYDKLVSAIGANGTNAYTWFDQTVYVNDIPSNQIENWAKIESERFSEVLPRLFHTELEAVYEEKNRGLDNDGRRVWEEVFASLFPENKYGTQTTIGTVEHLKNPSITAIKEYFNTYYVANNMAICLSGDMDLDKTIALIKANFSSLKSKELPENKTFLNSEIPQNIHKIVLGPSAESLTLAYKFKGADDYESLMMELVSMVLSNSQAGLIDLNLNQEQKVLGAYSYPLRLNNASVHILSARPRKDQTLDEVEALLLSQLKLIAEGDFPDWLLEAIINDYKLNRLNEMESNKSRADFFVSNFIRKQMYSKSLAEIEWMSKVTKQDLIDFVNKNYSERTAYVRVDKVQGEDNSIVKVTKPKITPVLLNRDKKSAFLVQLLSNDVERIEPKFIDFKKDVSKGKISYTHREIKVLYNQNTENQLFELYYIFDFGSDQNPKLGLALSYLQYLGCEGYDAAQLSQAFYKLGCNFTLSSTREQLYIGLYGLSENYDKAINLLETFLKSAVPDQSSYDELVETILKSRENSKLDKSTILTKALVNYAKYGSQSPFTTIIDETELQQIDINELTDLIKNISKFEHRVLYYGPKKLDSLENELAVQHPVQKLEKTPKSLQEYTFKKIAQDSIFFIAYDMVQAEMILLSKSKKYSINREVKAELFNEYFGGNMGSIVFQEMRESKALAYSVRSYYQIPSERENPGYIVSYIGTQADKTYDAIVGMNDLLNNFISEENAFQNSKESILSSIETTRSIKSGVLFDYLTAEKMKQKSDLNKRIYRFVTKSSIKDVQKFHKKYIQNQPQYYLVIGSKENINFEALEKFGPIKELQLSEVFGY